MSGEQPSSAESEALREVAALPLVEALYGRRSRRFALGAEIPDGPLAYRSKHEPLPLTELERMLVLSTMGGTTGWHYAITRHARYAPRGLTTRPGPRGARSHPRPASTPPSSSSPTTRACTSSPRVMPERSSTPPLCFFTQNGYAIYDDVNDRKIPGLEEFSGLVDIEDPFPLTTLSGYRERYKEGIVSTAMSPAEAARRDLSGFEGRLTGPDDADYDEARKVYNAMIDKRPGLVARCARADDVAKVVNFARDRSLLLAVRGGGHNGAGLGTCDDGVVLDLSALNDIEVDPDAHTVRVGGGCTWGEVDRATNQHGLATPSGIISTTGVGGLTLGGGLGNLTRTCGLTIDNLLEAEVVLANGERVTASDDENPDLYWAIRGGGGNFGVVTSFLFRLHAVGTVIAGPTFWPVEAAAEVLSAYREFLPNAPRELNAFFAFNTVPPAPPFPEEIHLRKICGLVSCYVGSEEDAAKAMAPLLDALPEPLLPGTAPMPHPDLQSAFDGVYPPGDQWYWRADFVKEIPDEAVEIHARFGAEMPTWKSGMHMYPIDGAAHDVGSSDTAWSYRDARWGSVIVGVDPDPANADLIRHWCVDYFEALHPYSAGGAYVNMMMDEGQDRVRASYRDNYDRLARVKATYDPDNLFHVNQNIEPAA